MYILIFKYSSLYTIPEILHRNLTSLRYKNANKHYRKIIIFKRKDILLFSNFGDTLYTGKYDI